MSISIDGSGSITGIDQGLNVVGVATYSTHLNVGGDLNVTGVLTYDDVTNIDSVGLVTARNGLHVTSGSVGIGTDNPTNMLDIAGSTPIVELNDTDTGVIHRVNANSGVGQFYFDSDINNVGSDGSFVFRHGHLGGGSQVFSISSIGTLTLGPNSGKIRRSGDIDTYINFDGSNEIEFVTANVERLRISSAGNIGINEDVPIAKLHINDSGNFPCLILPDSDNARYSVGFGNTNVFGVGQRLDFYAGDSGSNTTNLTSAARRMSLTSQGRLGIGTINPGENLTVNGSIESLCQVAVGSTEEGGEFILRAAPQQLTGTKYRYLIDNYYGTGSYGRASNDPVGGLRFLRQDDATSANGLIVCTIDEDGIVRHPYQPIASLSDSRTINLSGVDLNSSNFYDTTWLNQGSHFDASTGRFNCPVAGVYRIYFRCSQNGNSLKTNVRLRKNGATINEAYSNATSDSVSSEIVVQCSAGDYLHIQVAEIHTVGGSQHKQVTFQLLH